MKIEVPIRLGRGQNDRPDHWRVRHRQVASERDAVSWMLIGKARPALPCTVTITRIAPSAGLDDDNLSGACKAIRDAFAAWIGVDDKRREVVRYAYAQERGPWGVRVESIDGIKS